MARWVALVLVLILSERALARDADDEAPATGPATTAAADKSGYTLFNPTPAKLLRELNSDRPDVTEEPTTVDAGHIQIESSFAEYSYEKDHGQQSEEWSVLPTEVRLGVLNNLELSIETEPYLNVHTDGQGGSARANGTGDTEFRAKVNFWGNDGGMTAFGILPYIKIPTANDDLGNRHVEGGVILPLQINLPGGADLGLQIEADVLRNESNNAYGSDLLYTAVWDQPLFGPIAGYIEYVGVVPIRLGQTYQSYVDGGFLYLVNENVQLDAGINKGLTRSGFDYDVFSGITVRW